MKNTFLFFYLLCTCAVLHAQVPTGNTIWLDRPNSLKGTAVWFGGDVSRYGKDKPFAAGDQATNPDPEWEQRSLPIGNGHIGACILGSVSTERITLNEKSLWSGGPNIKKGAAYYWDVNKNSAPLLKEIRQAFAQENWEKAAHLTAQNFNGKASYQALGEESYRFGAFTTMGELLLHTDLNEQGITHYSRALSVDSAFAQVSFRTAQGVRHERRAFVSYPHNVLVLRLRADKPAQQNFRIGYNANPCAEGKWEKEGKNALVYRAALDNNGMRYTIRLCVLVQGGKVNNDNATLTVSQANEALVLLTADTDYRLNLDPDFNDPKTYVGVDPDQSTRKWLNKASRCSYEKLFATHYKDYARLYRRVHLQLSTPSAQSQAHILPTDQRLQAYRNGQQDLALEQLYFQFGRYLLIASSRTGNLPANLQGIWSNNVDAPWHADYHNNINLQMNYWPALPTGLAECTTPLTDLILSMRKPGQISARSYFNARGWMAGISGNPFGFTAPFRDTDMSWNYNPVAAHWLATHLWEYYAFTQDENFLRHTAYPILKELAYFSQDFLWQKPNGTLTAAPSTSPEHGPIDEGSTFTHALIRENFLQAIAAATQLNVDKNDIISWQNSLTHLAPYRIGRYGQLQEWSRDIDDPKDQHRHVNHLFGLHPGSTISPLLTPELATASKIVLNHRGDGATGWSMGWKLNQWARLHDGNRSYQLFANLLKHGTADNLWDMHPPFQIDGNFGGTAGVAEMLLQSHADCLHFLPALPDAWHEGKVTGLRARGGFVVDMEWNKGILQNLRLHSLAGKTCTLRYDNHVQEFSTIKGRTYHFVWKNNTFQLL